MATTCDYCKTAGDCRYDWNCPVCRARMLAALPNQALRDGWLGRWRDAGEEAMAAAVEARLLEAGACHN